MSDRKYWLLIAWQAMIAMFVAQAGGMWWIGGILALAALAYFFIAFRTSDAMIFDVRPSEEVVRELGVTHAVNHGGTSEPPARRQQ